MTTPSNQQVPQVQNQVVHTDDEFAAAMALVGSEPEEETPAPTEDPLEEAEEEAAKLPTAPKEVRPEEKADLELDPDKYDKLLMKRRQLWEQEKKLRQEKAAIAREREELAALKAPKRQSSGEPVEEILEGEEEWLPPSKLKEKLSKEIREELKQERQQEMAQAEQEAQVDIYKSQIVDEVFANEDKYPTISTFLDSDEIQEQAFAIVEDDFRAKAERFGQEYAAENVLTHEQAAGLLEKRLASKFKPKLESEKSKKFLRQFLGDQKASNQPGIQTLNSDLNSPSSPDEGPKDWDERVKWAANKFVKEE